MKDIKDLIKKALEAGFTGAVELDCDTVVLRTEVRDMCAANTCGQYNKNWSCPPGCGSLAECEEKLRKYKKGIIVQTTGELEDSMDFEGITELSDRHGETFLKFIHVVKSEYPDAIPVGTGCCTLCKTCTYPDGPCRFPDKAVSSMEAFGMVVSDVCKDNGIPYYYGPNTLTYVACFFLE